MSNSPATQANTQLAPLPGGGSVDIAAVDLLHEAVPAEQDGGDAPSTGSLEFGTLAGACIGVWEMSVGTMRDIEAEEFFVVTAGRGSVLIEPFGDRQQQRVELFPGSLMRLSEGMKSTWTITETLRKVYITAQDTESETQLEGHRS